MDTINHDEFASRHSIGWDGAAYTAERVTPKVIASIVQIRRNADEVLQLTVQTDAAWAARFGTAA